MLILKRRAQQALIITDTETGERIRVVVEPLGRRAAIGIEAGRRFHVLREELEKPPENLTPDAPAA